MYNIIPLIIILTALVAIVYIIIRRLSHVSTIDTSTISAEVVQKSKTRILDERLKRKFSGFFKKLTPDMSGMKEKVSGHLEETKSKLEDMKKKMEKEMIPKHPVTKEDFEMRQEFIEGELEEAQNLAIEENFEDAEKRFIDVISQDPKNSDAYLGLAELYVENKKYNEAIETYKFLHKLLPDSARVLAELAEAYEAIALDDQALDAIKQAVDIEPRNPKLLDKLTEVYIRRGDKKAAQEALMALAEVNPENQKLQDLQKEVNEL